MKRADHEIYDLNYEDIRDEARRVGGAGTLNVERMLETTTKV